MMEEEEIESSGGGMLPVALAVLAIVLGGAGLYFGITANQRIGPIAETVDGEASSTDEAIKSLTLRLEELAVRTDEVKKTVDRMKIYSSQSEQAIKKVADEVNKNRRQIVETAEKLNEFASAGFRPAPKPAAVESTGADTPAQPSGATQAAGSGTYTIKSGDTLGRVASKTGVDLQAILDANPGVDPRRLQIGQTIVLPSN